jgi:hypothetical protein
MPLAISLMAGATDFGLAYSELSTAQKSLRGATRYLARLPANAVCSWGQTNAKNLAVYGNIGGTGNPVISGWATSQVTLTQPTNCASSYAVIELGATVTYNSLMLPVVGLPGTVTLSTSHQERWIGE